MVPARPLLVDHVHTQPSHVPARGARPAWEALRRPLDEPRRRTVLRSALGTVEEVGYPAGWSEAGVEASPGIIVPLRGLVRRWNDAGDYWLDCNSALVTAGGSDLRMSHPIGGMGHVSLTITLEPFVFAQLFADASSLPRPTTAKLRLLANRIARAESAQADDILLTMLREIAASSPAIEPRKTSNIARIKQIVHGHSDDLLGLDQLARSVGVCPAYLTQEFTRYEGIPLYRYQKQLRLAQALQDLPGCADITALALELGFSNHSHFTAAFRQEFGLTPSAYRAECA